MSKRIYGFGTSQEDTSRCIYEVFQNWHAGQCSRKRGHGPRREYCKQHAKIIEARLKLRAAAKAEEGGG